jgi:hypothetical protein
VERELGHVYLQALHRALPARIVQIDRDRRIRWFSRADHLPEHTLRTAEGTARGWGSPRRRGSSADTAGPSTLTSGYSADVLEESFLENAEVRVLPKPYRFPELLRRIQHELRQGAD